MQTDIGEGQHHSGHSQLQPHVLTPLGAFRESERGNTTNLECSEILYPIAYWIIRGKPMCYMTPED